MDYEIIKAEPSDLEGIVEAWWQLMSEHGNRDPWWFRMLPDREARSVFGAWISSCMDHKEHDVLVARVGGRAVGFIHGAVLERPPVMADQVAGKVMEIAIDEAWRGKGIGRALLEAMERMFQKRGLLAMELMVDSKNPAALSLYKSFGMYERDLHMIKKIG